MIPSLVRRWIWATIIVVIGIAAIVMVGDVGELAARLGTFGWWAFGVALGARLVELCDVGRPGATRVLGVLLIHALALFWLTLLQAGWTRRVAAALRPAL